jgi:predicted metal-dependent phosphoesterase TrpH
MIDLHLHTTYSDGRLPPAEVVAEAVVRGLTHIAITDHDVLSGIGEARHAATGQGVEIIAGIEMTAAWEGPRAVHVLGLFVDETEPTLVAALDRARTLMGEHVDRVLEAVREVGGSLELADLDRYQHRYAGGAALVFGMLQRGVLRGTPAGTGMRLLRMAAYEPRAYSVGEAIALIHGAGGVASLAHPARIKRSQPLLDAADLAPFAEMGLDALEAWQWIPDGWGSSHYQAVAHELGLLVSGGSDDHGKRRADGAMRLGSQRIADEVLGPLRERARWWRERSPRPEPA